MTLTDLYRAVDNLTADDLTTLQAYIERRKREADSRQLQRVLDAWSEGLIDDEKNRIEEAMNGYKPQHPEDISECRD